MRAVLDSYGDRVLIGEIYLPVPKLVQYYGGSTLDEAHLPFNFQFVLLPEWNARVVREAVGAYEKALPEGAWPNWVLGNHDKSRIATRFGREQARIAQMLLLTLRGTPTVYYGDELAMVDGKIPPELIRDPQGKDHPEYSRDPQRTPMQWDTSANAGFCPADVEPWLPITDDYKSYNVASEQNDARSDLTLTRSLLALRAATPALQFGTYQVVDNVSTSCFVYLRQHADQRYLVVLNCTADEQVLRLSQFGSARITLSTHLDREGSIDLAELHLRSNEGYLLEIQ
jgi:alpha-glucosidase